MPPTEAQFENFLTGYSQSVTNTICIEKSVILSLLHKATIKKEMKHE